MMVAPARQDEARDKPSWLPGAFVGLLFLCVGVGLVLHPYTTGREMPGDLGDARFNLALLEFFYHSVVRAMGGHSADFANAPFFYPWPSVTNFSDTFWGDAGVYALVRALGVGEIAAFQIWFVAGFALTYAAALVSFRKLGLAPWGAAAGAFLFAFPLPMGMQFLHAQLVYRLWIPPALLAFDRLLRRRSIRSGAACVLFIALQLAVSIYLGMFLVLLLASYSAALWLFGQNRLTALPDRDSVRPVGAAECIQALLLLVAALILLAVVAIPYLDVQKMYGFSRTWSQVAGGLPRPQSYLLAGVSQLWPNLSNVFPLPQIVEQQLFPGLSAIIPVVWFLVSRQARARHALAPVMLGTAAILVALTIDLGGFTIYRLIYPLPGFSVLRAIGRVILVIMLPLSLLFGMLIDDLAGVGAYALPRHLVALLLLGFLVAECSLIGHPSSSPAEWRTRREALEAKMPKHLPAQAIFAVATGRHVDMPWIETQTDADVVAASLGIHTLNGYSGNYPPQWKAMATCRDVIANLRAGRHFLAEHGLKVPVIAPERIVLIGFGVCDLAALDRDPELLLGHAYHFADGADGNAFIGDGFSYPESWGRWTDGREAFLYFSLATSPAGPVSIAVEASTLSPAPDRRQTIEVSANGHSCGRLALAADALHAETVCPAGALRAGNNTLHFRIAHPTRPIDLGLNHDRRHLGIGLEMLLLSAGR